MTTMTKMTITTMTTTVCAILTLLTAAALAGQKGDLAASNNDFSLDVYRTVSAAAIGGNVVLSPTSILIGLGMVHAGSGGATKSQLSKTLHLCRYDDDEAAINDDFRRLIATLNRPNSSYTLRTANRLYARKGYPFREAFLTTTDEYFRAGLDALDFAGDADGSRRKINDWVSRTTEGKVKDLLPDGSVKGDTVLVIVNAIYFKGLWSRPFAKELTKEQTFHLSRTETASIPMMTRKATEFRYYDSAVLRCQIVELPYVGLEVSMLVLLPHDVDGLAAVEAGIGSAESLGQILGSMASTTLDVSLPRFVVDQGVALKQFLERLGVVDLFRPNADLSGIDGTRDLYATEAVHKVYIAVDEQGTEAAGATGVVIRPKSGRPSEPPPAVKFVADHPFLFALVERTTTTVLFIGRLVSPPRPGSSSDDIGVFGKTAEQRCCLGEGEGGSPDDDGSQGTSVNYARRFLGLWLPVLTSLVVKLMH